MAIRHELFTIIAPSQVKIACDKLPAAKLCGSVVGEAVVVSLTTPDFVGMVSLSVVQLAERNAFLNFCLLNQLH